MTVADVRFTSRDAAVVAHLSGEVDMSNAADLASAVAGAATNDMLGVVVDLSCVDFLDSAGIRLLFRLRESLRARGQRLSLVIPDFSPVNDALRLAGVRRLVATSPSVDAALRDISADC